MIAFHFPPFTGSSGVQRTLRFVQHLPSFGWNPIVLTAHSMAYEQKSSDLMSDIPAGVPVIRVPCFDARRHFSVRGRYPRVLARPDRWISWKLSAVPTAVILARRFAVNAIWSTYPIASAHSIASTVQRFTGLPWVADFRDPMAQEGYPDDPVIWDAYARIERTTFARARAAVFTTRGAAASYLARYPAISGRTAVIENGFDEESFSGSVRPAPLNPGTLTLLHSGVVYPVERDPSTLFAAIATLRRDGLLGSRGLRLRFRAPTHTRLIEELAARYGVRDLIECLSSVPYREALDEMVRADGLIALQAGNCNQQIPAKVYEYLRAGRPILGLADPAGDTGDLLKRAGVEYVAALEDVGAVTRALQRFIADLTESGATRPDASVVARFSRREGARDLANLLDVASREVR